MSAVIQLEPLLNRHDKRAYLKERKKVEHLLVGIEVEFEYALFHSPESITYNDLYLYFLNKWSDIIENLKSTQKFKYIGFDAWHFPRMYKSIV
tara:strand:- start:129 stop:407 length:279 start_codon:yes stop_codon:yes gene_type:complete